MAGYRRHSPREMGAFARAPRDTRIAFAGIVHGECTRCNRRCLLEGSDRMNLKLPKHLNPDTRQWCKANPFAYVAAD